MAVKYNSRKRAPPVSRREMRKAAREIACPMFPDRSRAPRLLPADDRLVHSSREVQTAGSSWRSSAVWTCPSQNAQAADASARITRQSTNRRQPEYRRQFFQPASSFLLLSFLRLYQGERQLPLHGVYTIQKHFHLIPNRERPPGSFTDNLTRIFVEFV